ncbi:hypothetical protein SteCoe_18350 [Stentor coeruleus]|uniref:MORN repeat protein n=1 Tax=Stentor coeruleus TaxID=5963 RepID=A0A1R2BWN6_9CILI|nr:hypothetical protein SteCoe_18350 [Stentor coeruleus]
MGNCNCINNIDEQHHLNFLDQPVKQENEQIECPGMEITMNNCEQAIQGLIRGYLTRKKFKSKKSSPQSTNETVDVKKYLPESIIGILDTMKEIDTLIDGEVVKTDDDTYYIGQWKNKKITGTGHVIQKNAYYHGDLKDGIMNGKGMLVNHNGNWYIGSFSNGKYHGYGEFFIKESNYKYEGDWEYGKQKGNGIEKWQDGATCKAEFIDGVKCGLGEFAWADGSRYKGEFHMNHIEGIGHYKWPDNREYKGQWQNSKMHGKGVFEWPDGRIYEGDYVNDKKEGNGVFTWDNGKKYDGQWKDGKQHGIGVLYEPGKKTKKGEWKNGKRIKWIE